jgi:hypothetical protein
MEASQRSILDKGTSLAKLAGVLEVMGWIGVIGAIIGAIVIGSADISANSTTFGGINTSTTTETWPFAIAFGVTAVLGSLMLIAIARALVLFAHYAVAHSVDVGTWQDDSAHTPPDAGGGLKPF